MHISPSPQTCHRDPSGSQHQSPLTVSYQKPGSQLGGRILKGWADWGSTELQHILDIAR